MSKPYDHARRLDGNSKQLCSSSCDNVTSISNNNYESNAATEPSFITRHLINHATANSGASTGTSFNAAPAATDLNGVTARSMNNVAYPNRSSTTERNQEADSDIRLNLSKSGEDIANKNHSINNNANTVVDNNDVTSRQQQLRNGGVNIGGATPLNGNSNFSNEAGYANTTMVDMVTPDILRDLQRENMRLKKEIELRNKKDELVEKADVLANKLHQDYMKLSQASDELANDFKQTELAFKKALDDYKQNLDELHKRIESLEIEKQAMAAEIRKREEKFNQFNMVYEEAKRLNEDYRKYINELLAQKGFVADPIHLGYQMSPKHQTNPLNYHYGSDQATGPMSAPRVTSITDPLRSQSPRSGSTSHQYNGLEKITAAHIPPNSKIIRELLGPLVRTTTNHC